VFREDEIGSFIKFQKTLYSAFDPLLKIGADPIKFIGHDDMPIFKYLGRKIQVNLKTDLIVAEITSKINNWLQTVDRTLLTGPMKAWIVNHHVCAKLAWHLLIYDFPVTQARRWQALIQPFFRRWVGLAAAAEASVLYRAHEHFGLNFKHLGEMLERLQVARWLILKYSQDPQARELYKHRLQRDQSKHYGKGRRSSPCLQIEELEGESKLQQIIGRAQHGTRGLGYGASETLAEQQS
jgi:hypothetical protein